MDLHKRCQLVITATGASMKKIIIADDSQTMRRVISNMLSEIGEFEILTADGGDIVMELVEKHPDVDLILLDWNMPVMNGLDCLKALRCRPETAKTAIIMVTSEALRERILEAIQSGATNYLMKPFEKDKLQLAIEAIFNP